jgi:hypothetical protein
MEFSPTPFVIQIIKYNISIAIDIRILYSKYHLYVLKQVTLHKYQHFASV